MLYDILPPLLLFASLGGIILVVSRVALRIRRQHLAVAVQAEGASAAVPAEELLNPDEGGVKLMRNRLFLAGAVTKNAFRRAARTPGSLKGWRGRRQQRKAKIEAFALSQDSAPSPERGQVQAPESGWRQGLGSLLSRTRSSLGAAGKTLGKKSRSLIRTLPKAYPKSVKSAESPEPAPAAFRLRRIENPTPPLPESAIPQAKIPASAAPSVTGAEKPGGSLISRIRQKQKQSHPLKVAQEAFQAEKYQQAEDILVPYLAKHPRQLSAYVLLGQIALQRKNWNEAMEIFEQVVKLNPARPGAYAALGFAALRAGRITRALQALQRAHDAEPGNTNVLKHILTIAHQMDNRALQRSTLEKLIQLHPEDKSFAQALQTLNAKHGSIAVS